MEDKHIEDYVNEDVEKHLQLAWQSHQQYLMYRDEIEHQLLHDYNENKNTADYVLELFALKSHYHNGGRFKEE